MMLVYIVTALAVAIGAIIPPVIAGGFARLGMPLPFPAVVVLTASGIALFAALLRLIAPDPTATALEQREAAVKAREERAAQVDERITLRMHDITDQAADLDRTRRDLDARASALYTAEADHQKGVNSLAERLALFDMVQVSAEILEARNRLDGERAALRDERAALTGERIALDAVKTIHATAVRKHAAEVKAAAANRKPAPARASRKQEGAA